MADTPAKGNHYLTRITIDLGLLTLNLTNMGLLSMFSLRPVSLLSIAQGDSSMMRMCILFQCCVVQDLQFL